MKCSLEDRLLDFLFEFCLDVFHKDEVSECLFFVSKGPISMIGYTIESCIFGKYIIYSHDHQTHYHSYTDDTPIAMKLVKSKITIDVLKLISIHDENDYSMSSAKMI